MLYPNLIAACDCLGHELYSFCGHGVDPAHTSFISKKRLLLSRLSLMQRFGLMQKLCRLLFLFPEATHLSP